MDFEKSSIIQQCKNLLKRTIPAQKNDKSFYFISPKIAIITFKIVDLKNVIGLIEQEALKGQIIQHGVTVMTYCDEHSPEMVK